MYAIRSYYADNLCVTQNYVYIQEDPNGYFDTADKMHFAQLYQYNIQTGALKVVLECDQNAADRITSYNVCYTKLLRSGKSISVFVRVCILVN